MRPLVMSSAEFPPRLFVLATSIVATARQPRQERLVSAHSSGTVCCGKEGVSAGTGDGYSYRICHQEQREMNSFVLCVQSRLQLT